MDNYILFGAGKLGTRAYYCLKEKKITPIAFVDSKLSGEKKHGIPILSLDELLDYSNYKLIITCGAQFWDEIDEMLSNLGITNYEYMPDEWLISPKKLYTFCPGNREDIILNFALEDVDSVFYIDIGSNDPSEDSVTKLMYEKNKARGINVEPLRDLCNRCNRERTKDINLCVGVGKESGRKLFYENGGLSTLVEQNVTWNCCNSYEIEIVTLKSICEKYVNVNDIHLLKIDVEGFEREVLEGADFHCWRPWIIVIESTYPNTKISCHMLWEDLLLESDYHFVYSYGVNRYYVANERNQLDSKFIDMTEIESIYDLFSVERIITN